MKRSPVKTCVDLVSSLQAPYRQGTPWAGPQTLFVFSALLSFYGWLRSYPSLSPPPPLSSFFLILLTRSLSFLPFFSLSLPLSVSVFLSSSELCSHGRKFTPVRRGSTIG
jgi:hypothetical protein